MTEIFIEKIPEKEQEIEQQKEKDMTTIVKEIPTFLEAIKCCIRQSGLTEKQIYLELEIDKGHWCRTMSGQAHFPLEKLRMLMKICGNQIPLEWLAYKEGFELRVMHTTLEEKIEEQEKTITELKKKNEYINEILRKIGLRLESKDLIY